MSHTTSQKIKLLVLYDILCRLTDEEHALNTDELINLLGEKGIQVDPRVLKSDIDMLNDYGYEVLSYKKKYYYGGLVKGIADLANTKLFYLVLPYSDIQSGKQGRFRLNRKALIVTLKTGEEIVFAVADKHKKWFALMDEKVNCNN